MCVFQGRRGGRGATYGMTAVSVISGWPISIASNSAGATCIICQQFSYLYYSLNKTLLKYKKSRTYLITIVLDQFLDPIDYVNITFIIKVT